MKSKSLAKVNFFCSKDNRSKVQWICECVANAIKLDKRILLMVPNDEAAKYVDHLLWRIPEESFIPHAIVQGSSKECTAITTSLDHNWNGASRLLHLCPTVSPIFQQFEEIDELYDETHPQKEESSKQRLLHYQTHGANINRVNF